MKILIQISTEFFVYKEPGHLFQCNDIITVLIVHIEMALVGLDKYVVGVWDLDHLPKWQTDV